MHSLKIHWGAFLGLQFWELWEKDRDNPLTLRLIPAISELQME